jgi:Ribbon-helix-helix protein, copG family
LIAKARHRRGGADQILEGAPRLASHLKNMGSRMKTTLNIDATVMAELKREAARQGRTMSEVVETALRYCSHVNEVAA